MRLRREDHTGYDIVFANVAAMSEGIFITKNLAAENFVGGVITVLDGADSAGICYYQIVNVLDLGDRIQIEYHKDQTNVFSYVKATGEIKLLGAG